MQIALIVGHTLKKPGAFSKALGHEYGFNKQLADKVYWELRRRQIPSLVFVKDNMEQSAVHRQVNEYLRRPKPMAIEFHFNASLDGKAIGTETLYDADPPEGKILAALMQQKIAAAFSREGEQDRGAKLIEEGDRGHRNLAGIDVPACIIEPFFGDNQADCDLVQARMSDLVAAICDGCEAFANAY